MTESSRRCKTSTNAHCRYDAPSNQTGETISLSRP